MIENSYNIFAELRGEIEDFDQKGVFLVGKPTVRDEWASADRRGREGGYYYSQKDLNEAIDLASASKFKHGPYDSQGKRKTYLNIVNFHADVALNQTNINAAHYIFEPTEDEYTWPVFAMDKKFKEWSDENSYDDIIDETQEDWARRGSCVSKRIKDGIERVPLRTLRNTQTAKTLEDAARNGGYVIIENEMPYSKMQKYKGWKLDGLSKKKPITIFERYSLVPRATLKEFKKESIKESDYEELVCCVQMLAPDTESFKKTKKDSKGVIVFVEEIIDGKWPLDEAHYEKIDGRWQGRGEIEKQLENQISRNLTANLRQRSLLWAATKLFQSSDEEVAGSTMLELKDGFIIKVNPDGDLTQVNTGSQHLADFAADDNAVIQNSQQISFSFDSSTGETMPANTPYRLGALLDAAVSKYFKRKQDKFSNYLKRSFFDQLLPIFKKQMKEEHTLRYSIGDDQYEQVLEAMAVVHANDIVRREWRKKNFISMEEAKQMVIKELGKSPYLFLEIPKDFYDNAHCYMRLNINEPIAADIETLTNLYTDLSGKGDPRAERILRMILSKKGKNLDYILGAKAAAPAPMAPMPNAPTPSPYQPSQTVQ